MSGTGGLARAESVGPSRKRPPGISFGTAEPWIALSQNALASLPATELCVKVWLLALSRMDKHGHAPMRRGELVAKLSDVDPDTGEILWQPGDQAVSQAIGKAKRLGWLSKDSNRRCLRVPQRLAQNSRKGAPNLACCHAR